MTTYDSDGKWIDTMQICKNGHVINDSYERFPEKNQDYCQICSKETMIECKHCNKPIQGRIHHRNVYGGHHPMPAPNYCRYCRKPYPWNKGTRKVKTKIKSGFEYLKKSTEWSVEQIRKLRKE